ncbi:hypothetical protein AGMMS49545_13760 [Betaproteobacteria bacterium]|nr:hypothetical protein AGMMS49545_13760 [Betaproteobacteria bacterium]GHU45452.1 hypothetical protein AGMMS50289_16710 [Betaproteobacteria bacterium]
MTGICGVAIHVAMEDCRVALLLAMTKQGSRMPSPRQGNCMNANEITNTAFREARLYGHGCTGTARRAPTPFFTPSPLVGEGWGEG